MKHATLEHLSCPALVDSGEPPSFVVVAAIIIDERGDEPYLDGMMTYLCDGARPVTVTLPPAEQSRLERLLLDQYMARCREDAREDAIAACWGMGR